MQALKAAPWYGHWCESQHEVVVQLQPGHLFTGQLSISDVKLKLTQITQ